MMADSTRIWKRRRRRRRRRRRERGRGGGGHLKSNQKKKFPKIASIDPPNVCTKFIVRYKKFK